MLQSIAGGGGGGSRNDSAAAGEGGERAERAERAEGAEGAEGASQNDTTGGTGATGGGGQFICTTFRPEMLLVAEKCYGVRYERKSSSVVVVSREEALSFVEGERQ